MSEWPRARRATRGGGRIEELLYSVLTHDNDFTEVTEIATLLLPLLLLVAVVTHKMNTTMMTWSSTRRLRPSRERSTTA